MLAKDLRAERSALKFINLTVRAPLSEVADFISDNKRVNANVRFEPRCGTPFMHVKKDGEKLKIKCEMMDRPTKDNGFLVGTYFKGRLTEQGGVTRLRGVILTSPIYHLVWLALLAILVWQCFRYAALSVAPVMFVAMEVLMFHKEFKKQGYIKRYLCRAFSRIERGKSAN